MKNSEIREYTTEELLEKVEVSREELVKLRMGHTVTPLENPNLIKANKRTIARLLTELRSREQAASA